ncbi:MAG: STAS domain-containing protein [Clostridium sp.]
MEVIIKDVNHKKYIELKGRLDSNSSNDVTEKILDVIKDESDITIDMSKCSYVSSAGLRTLLTIGKIVKMKSGHMNIINLVEEVREVMEMTGFGNIFKDFEQ